MDTNKENELMQNLERQVGGGDAGHLPDGRPSKAGEEWQTVNPPGTTQNVSQQRAMQAEMQQAAVRAAMPQTEKVSRPEETLQPDEVTPEMVNRIEMYGTEAVYNAGEDS